MKELQGDGSTSLDSSQSQELLSDHSDADSMQGSPQFRVTAATDLQAGDEHLLLTHLQEDKNVRVEDWVPALERAAQWNGWTKSEQLLQLAGHLQGKALQERRSSLGHAVEALKSRLDPGSQALAVQEFRNLSQHDKESVSVSSPDSRRHSGHSGWPMGERRSQ